MALSKQAVYRHLKEIGLLLSFEKDKTTIRRTLQDRERAVLHLSAGALTPAETGGTGGKPEKTNEKQPFPSPGSQNSQGEQGEPGPWRPPVSPVPPVSGTEGVAP
jgi:hypothetical protein